MFIVERRSTIIKLFLKQKREKMKITAKALKTNNAFC